MIDALWLGRAGLRPWPSGEVIDGADAFIDRQWSPQWLTKACWVGPAITTQKEHKIY